LFWKSRLPAREGGFSLTFSLSSRGIGVRLQWMKRIYRILLLLALFPTLTVTSCRDKETPASPAAAVTDLIGTEEVVRFRNETRQLYNNRKFAELEALAEKIRTAKERFPGGTWKIHQFHTCMDCSDEEPESMWKLHEKIHQEWEAKYPASPTARIATAQFYIRYAWQARSSAYADEVTEEGWQLFGERLAQARSILDQTKSLTPACPMWWSIYQTVALGQGWDREEYDALFKEAVKFEPEFDPYDCSRAKYLLPRWHGEPGEWEQVADQEIALRGEIGHQIYARVVDDQAGYYQNVFEESDASWRKTRQGYEDLVARFPTSASVLNSYCRLACLAGDKAQAKKLFEKIGPHQVSAAWKKNEFKRAKEWATSGK
jgi:Domain of unknown function (DUF4034)